MTVIDVEADSILIFFFCFLYQRASEGEAQGGASSTTEGEYKDVDNDPNKQK